MNTSTPSKPFRHAIGNYLDLVRHYNISTDIRRKLGLDTNGENLGPFLRKMMTGK